MHLVASSVLSASAYVNLFNPRNNCKGDIYYCFPFLNKKKEAQRELICPDWANGGKGTPGSLAPECPDSPNKLCPHGYRRILSLIGG